MEPNIDINFLHRKESAVLLNTLLADEYALYTKTLNYHWNVISPHFDATHLFLKRQYEQIFVIVDDVAERARSLGERAFGTMEEFSSATHINEEPGLVPSEEQMLKNLLHDHESIIRRLRTDQKTVMEQYNDVGTNNFLCDLIEQHEKMAWMLRSSLPVQNNKE